MKTNLIVSVMGSKSADEMLREIVVLFEVIAASTIAAQL